MKVLHHHFAEDQEFVERFRREASSAAALSHPNIVGIFDRGEWNGTYYIAMEYVAGRSLKAIVREDGALDPATAIDIVMQILRAARFAHRRGVIHRDLKPHNVILDEEGRARVTDFGIARAGASDMTLTGSIMGTAQYLSPEQAQGYAVSAASDLYSVGVILYELLTGVVPFEGEIGRRDRLQAGLGRAAPAERAEPRAPARRSTRSCCARSPRTRPQRYADADELIAALEARARGPARLPAAPAMRAAYPTAATALAEPPRHRLAAGRAAAGPRAPRRSPARRGRSRRRRWWLWPLLARRRSSRRRRARAAAHRARQVTVPDVVGQTEQAAGAALRRAGLEPVPSLAPSTTVPTGLVVEPDPGRGQRVDKGSHVRSSSPAARPARRSRTSRADTPPKPSDAARRRASSPTTKATASTTVAAGLVIGTEPPAGTDAAGQPRDGARLERPRTGRGAGRRRRDLAAAPKRRSPATPD